jgi:hypothetical protein
VLLKYVSLGDMKTFYRVCRALSCPKGCKVVNRAFINSYLGKTLKVEKCQRSYHQFGTTPAGLYIWYFHLFQYVIRSVGAFCVFKNGKPKIPRLIGTVYRSAPVFQFAKRLKTCQSRRMKAQWELPELFGPSTGQTNHQECLQQRRYGVNLPWTEAVERPQLLGRRRVLREALRVREKVEESILLLPQRVSVRNELQEH